MIDVTILLKEESVVLEIDKLQAERTFMMNVLLKLKEKEKDL